MKKTHCDNDTIASKLKFKNANSGQLFQPDWVSSAEPVPTYTSSIFVRGPLLSVFTCSFASVREISLPVFFFRCRKGYIYVGNKTCALDPCFEENRDGELCGDLECVVTNDTYQAMCR